MKSSRIATLAVYAVLALGAVTVVTAVVRSGNAPTQAAEGKTLDVRVSWSRTTLAVTNVSAPAGREMTVYLNGQPPFTYRATTTVPAAGQTVRLALNDFTMKDGTRFNPFGLAVTEAWVGGGSYDYAKFQAR